MAGGDYLTWMDNTSTNAMIGLNLLSQTLDTISLFINSSPALRVLGQIVPAVLILDGVIDILKLIKKDQNSKPISDNTKFLSGGLKIASGCCLLAGVATGFAAIPVALLASLSIAEYCIKVRKRAEKKSGNSPITETVKTDMWNLFIGITGAGLFVSMVNAACLYFDSNKQDLWLDLNSGDSDVEGAKAVADGALEADELMTGTEKINRSAKQASGIFGLILGLGTLLRVKLDDYNKKTIEKRQEAAVAATKKQALTRDRAARTATATAIAREWYEALAEGQRGATAATAAAKAKATAATAAATAKATATAATAAAAVTAKATAAVAAAAAAEKKAAATKIQALTRGGAARTKAAAKPRYTYAYAYATELYRRMFSSPTIRDKGPGQTASSPKV